MLNHLLKLSEVQFPQRARNARFDITRSLIYYAPRFYKILLCKTDWLTERSAGSRSGRIRAVPSERSEQGAVSPAGSRTRSEVNSGSTSRAVRLIPLPAFEYSAVLSHLSKLSEVPVPAAGILYTQSCRSFTLCAAAVLPSAASERSEAAKRAEADARKQSFMHCLQQ